MHTLLCRNNKKVFLLICSLIDKAKKVHTTTADITAFPTQVLSKLNVELRDVIS